MIEIPLWIISIFWITQLTVLVWVHKRMTIWEKLAMVTPAICLAFLYSAYSFLNVSPELQRATARITTSAYLLWNIALLLFTRKRHL